MQLLPILIVIEIIAAGIFVNTSSSSYHTLHTSLQGVLGARLLAQDASDTSYDTQDTPTPTDTQDSQPTDTPTPTDIPTDTPTPPDISQPDSMQQSSPSLAPDETSLSSIDTSSPDQATALTITPTDTPVPTQNVFSTPIPSVDTSIEDTNASVNTAVDTVVLSQSTLPFTSSPVDTQTTSQAQQQDTEIANATTPQQQNTALLQAVKENVLSMNDQTIQHNYSNTAFLTQRVNDEIMKAIKNTQDIQSPAALTSVQLLCKQANLSLMTQQLLVPETLEQDIQIARGLCTSIQ